MAKKEIHDLSDYGLTPKQMEFCRNYIYDWNATRAYMKAFNTENYNVAGVESHNLLKKPKVKDYINHLQAELEKIANISRLKVLKEHIKIAFEDEEAGSGRKKNKNKIRIPDKQKSLEYIAKMMGYDAPLNINLKNEVSTKPIIIIGGEASDEDKQEV